MADSFLAYQNPGVTDKKLDSFSLTVGANTVEREVVILGGEGADDLILPIAHDTADAGSPIKIGGKASSSAPADVTAADRVDAYFDLKGRQAVFTDVALPTGANVIGALSANQSVNLAQIAAGTTITGGVTGSLAIGGNVAHDGVNSGNPNYAGAEAIAHGTNPTAVAAADRTKLYANRAGVPFVIGGHPNVVTIELAVTGAQTDVAIVTIGASLKIVVTQIQVVTDEANTVGVGFRVGFGTANTPTTTGVVASHPGMVPGTGLSRGDGSGILGVGADNEDLRVTSEVPTGGSVRFIVSYYTIES